jgi:hypothetical protein
LVLLTSIIECLRRVVTFYKCLFGANEWFSLCPPLLLFFGNHRCSFNLN